MLLTSVKEQNILIRWTGCWPWGPLLPDVRSPPWFISKALTHGKTCFCISVLSCSVCEEGKLSIAVCCGYFSPQSTDELFSTWFVQEKLGYTTVTELGCRNRILFKELLVQKKASKAGGTVGFPNIHTQHSHLS